MGSDRRAYVQSIGVTGVSLFSFNEGGPEPLWTARAPRLPSSAWPFRFTLGFRAFHRVRYFGCCECRVSHSMNREYHKAYSQELHRDMEALVFGHAGTPLLVFPTSHGEDFSSMKIGG